MLNFKNLKRKKALIPLTFLLIGLSLGSLITYALLPAGILTISEGVYPGAPSYTIWKYSFAYYAKNQNGEIETYSLNFSAVFQYCINQVPGKIFFKNGEYTLTNTVYFYYANSITLEGEDIENTIIKNNALTTTFIQLGNGANADHDFTGRLIIRNLQFHGNDKNVNFIYLSNVANNVFNLLTDTVKFRNFGTDSAIDSGSKWFIDCTFIDTRFWYGGTSIILKQPSHAFYSCHFWELDNGVYFQQGAGAQFFGGIFSHNGRDLSFADSTNYPDVFAFYATWFEDSSDALMGSGSSNISQLIFSACNFHTNGTNIATFPDCNGSCTIIGGQVRTGSGTAFDFGDMTVETINFEAYP